MTTSPASIVLARHCAPLRCAARASAFGAYLAAFSTRTPDLRRRGRILLGLDGLRRRVVIARRVWCEPLTELV